MLILVIDSPFSTSKSHPFPVAGAGQQAHQYTKFILANQQSWSALLEKPA
jgi:hypothetical protein